MSFYQSNRRNILTLDSIALTNSCHEISAMHMQILSSNLTNYKLKFKMGNCKIRDNARSPRTYRQNIDMNELVVKNSSFKTLDIFSVVSIEIQSSNAYFDDILVEGVNQSVPIIYSLERSFVFINNSDFNDISITHKMSSIIAANKSEVDIENCNFIKTEVQTGAVVLATSARVRVNDSVFNGNSVKSRGAVIYAVQSVINVYDSNLGRNKAQIRCYVISARRSNVTMRNVTSLENVGYNGGVLRADNRSYLHIHDSNFTMNNANHYGGVIYASKSIINLTNNIFEGNSAKSSGGFISATDYVKINVNRCLFVNNKASQYGGCIFTKYNTQIKIRNSSFLENKAVYGSGGLIDAYHNNVVYLEDCQIDRSFGKKAGVFSLLGNNHLYVKNSNFNRNKGTLNTGVLRVEQGAKVAFENCIFYNNSAALTESVLTAYEDVNMTIDSCLFDWNTSPFSGILIATKRVNIVVKNSTITRNVAHVESQIEIGSGSTLRVNNTSFHQNKGGNLIYGAQMSELFFSNCNFSNHSVAADPIIVISSSYLELTNSNFINNTQNKQGGVIIGEDRSNTSVISCQFVGNKASKGGVFYLTGGSSVTVQRSSFIGNSAGDGGVAFLIKSRATFIETQFLHTVCLGYGGIIKSYKSDLVVRDSVSFFNQAVFGGCFYLEIDSSLAAYNSVFENNTAMSGGVVYKYGLGNVSMENCTLVNNSRGAIFSQDSNYLRLSRGICQNVARYDGDCIKFDCSRQYLCQLYTYEYSMSNGTETVNTTKGCSLTTFKKLGLVSGTDKCLETPYGSSKYLLLTNIVQFCVI